MRCIVTGFFAFRIDRQIVIGTQRQRDAPPCHGQFRIELGRALKRSPRFVVIESVDEVQSLIEKLLGLAIFGRNRMMNIAQTGN